MHARGKIATKSAKAASAQTTAMIVARKAHPSLKHDDNAFVRLGFSFDEAQRFRARGCVQAKPSLWVRRQLTEEIAKWIRDTGVTQAAAAKILDVDRSRVSHVFNHRVERFTIDALVEMLSRIGKSVSVVVR